MTIKKKKIYQHLKFSAIPPDTIFPQSLRNRQILRTATRTRTKAAQLKPPPRQEKPREKNLKPRGLAKEKLQQDFSPFFSTTRTPGAPTPLEVRTDHRLGERKSEKRKTKKIPNNNNTLSRAPWGRPASIIPSFRPRTTSPPRLSWLPGRLHPAAEGPGRSRGNPAGEAAGEREKGPLLLLTRMAGPKGMFWAESTSDVDVADGSFSPRAKCGAEKLLTCVLVLRMFRVGLVCYHFIYFYGFDIF